MKILYLTGSGLGNLLLATPAFHSIIRDGHQLTIHPGSVSPHVTKYIYPYEFEYDTTKIDFDDYTHIVRTAFYDGSLLPPPTKTLYRPYSLRIPEYKYHLKLITELGVLNLSSKFIARSDSHDRQIHSHPYHVFLAPTGQLTQSVKRWPFFTDLATALLDKGYRVFVAGLKKDFNNVTFDPRVTLLVDRPLGEIGDVIRSCAFTVANDCGLMHYSNALGIHTYVISGPIPPIKSVPPGVFSISKISCPHQPCYAKFPDWNVAPDSGICHHQCMWDVSVDYVLSKLPLLG